VYHKWNANQKSLGSTLMLFGASQRTEHCIDNYLEHIDDPFQAHPFELHVVFLGTAIASWRPYLIYLHDKIVELVGSPPQQPTKLTYGKSDKAIITPIGKQDSLRDHYVVDVQDYQSLKTIEDRTSDALLCMDSTLETITTLADMHCRSFQPSRNGNGTAGVHDDRSSVPNAILYALKEHEREVLYTRKKVEALLSKAQNTRALVSRYHRF
jgi:hypothetical protein